MTRPPFWAVRRLVWDWARIVLGEIGVMVEDWAAIVRGSSRVTEGVVSIGCFMVLTVGAYENK